MSERLHGRVAVITGGGAGIGSASALELARQGATVVVMDPGVGVQGEEMGEASAAETAERVKAEGGKATYSTASVSDQGAVEELFQKVKRDFGSLDIVLNSAGILRRSRLADTTEDDWLAVFDVHFNGYLNVLSAALPMMTDAGYGRVVGFTSGVGLARVSLDQTAYGCAKRSVAALTWELGPLLPEGVNLNALAPIAGTRMIQDALASRPGGRSLDLAAAPQAEDIAPAAAYLSGDRLAWCRGQVFSSAGSELSVIGRPRLIEAVRTEGVADFASALETLVPKVLQPSEANQRSGGGAIARLGDVFTLSAGTPVGNGVSRAACLVVSDDPSLAAAVGAALRTWAIKPVGVGSWEPFDVKAVTVPSGFDAAERILASAAAIENIDAIVIITLDEAESDPTPGPNWRASVEAHRSVVPRVIEHATWARAAARYAIESGRPMRVVHVNGAGTMTGRIAAQGIAQLSRRKVNDVTPPAPCDSFSVSVESATSNEHRVIGQLVGYLVGSHDGLTLAGAELVAGNGWVGLRGHPGPTASATFGGPTIPFGVDEALRLAI